MSQPPLWLLYTANATLALATVALALVVATAVPRSRARRLPGGWAFPVLLGYLGTEFAVKLLASIGWLPEARWVVIGQAALVAGYVLAWRAVLLAAYPPPSSPAEQAAVVAAVEPLTAAVQEMVAKVEIKGE